MSFLTDCYTPAEAKHRLTRQCLKLLLESGHKVRLQTRSVMVEQDFDLLAAHGDRVRLGTSLPHLDDALARVLEPRAAAPTRRLEMLRRAADRGIPVYAAIAPVMPRPWTQLHAIRLQLEGMPLTETFCEVLNPKGGNLEMVTAALRASPFQTVLKSVQGYGQADWAATTWAVLTDGMSRFFGLNFIPWPDTWRGWAKWLDEEQVQHLDQWLPAKEVAHA
jgi:hypothetical protein